MGFLPLLYPQCTAIMPATQFTYVCCFQAVLIIKYKPPIEDWRVKAFYCRSPTGAKPATFQEGWVIIDVLLGWGVLTTVKIFRCISCGPLDT